MNAMARGSNQEPDFKPAVDPAAVERLEKLLEQATREAANREKAENPPSTQDRSNSPEAHEGTHGSDGAASVGKGEVYFMYRDRAGVEHIADDLRAIPKPFRKKARRVEFGPRSEGRPAEKEGSWWSQLTGGVPTARERPSNPPAASGVGFDPVSFLIGIMVGALVAVVISRRKAIPPRWVTVIALVFLGVVGMGLYAGWVQRQAGLDGGLIANPAEAVDEARRARRMMEEGMRERQKLLDDIAASEDR